MDSGEDSTRRGGLERVLASLVRQLARQAVALAPFMPIKAQELWIQLGGSGEVASAPIRDLHHIDTAGWRVTRSGPLFPKEADATVSR